VGSLFIYCDSKLIFSFTQQWVGRSGPGSVQMWSLWAGSQRSSLYHLWTHFLQSVHQFPWGSVKTIRRFWLSSVQKEMQSSSCSTDTQSHERNSFCWFDSLLQTNSPAGGDWRPAETSRVWTTESQRPAQNQHEGQIWEIIWGNQIAWEWNPPKQGFHTALHHRGRERRSEWRTWGFTDGENSQNTRHSDPLQWHL